MRAILFGASLIALSVPAVSATPAKPRTPVAKPADASKSAPDMSAVFAMFDKMFPPQPDPDPARLALARTAAAALLPNGTYANMMVDMTTHMYDGAMRLKASDMPGMTKGGAGADANLSLHDMAVAKDPYFDQRAAAIKDVIADGASQVSAIMDPRLREGMARSMARRFDEKQLTDINAFFATPSGHALAGQYLAMWVDPDMMRSIFSSMPDMMKLMPGLMEKAKVAAMKYPAPTDDKAEHKGKSSKGKAAADKS